MKMKKTTDEEDESYGDNEDEHLIKSMMQQFFH